MVRGALSFFLLKQRGTLSGITSEAHLMLTCCAVPAGGQLVLGQFIPFLKKQKKKKKRPNRYVYYFGELVKCNYSINLVINFNLRK